MPHEHITLGRGLKGQKLRNIIFALTTLIFLIPGCAARPLEPTEQQARQFIDEHTAGAIGGAEQPQAAEKEAPGRLPVRYQRPSYSLGNVQSGLDESGLSTVSIPVGAKYVTSGPKPLSHVLQVLAELKSMNISWASDVDKSALVHVTIMPEEDFFQAIDNILRQLDYSYELQGNTIVIKHKETKTFHVAMPFVSSSYSTGVGGDVLGSTAGNMSGKLNIASDNNLFDIWANIRTNLDQILQIWSTSAAPATTTSGAAATGTAGATAPAAAAGAATPAPAPTPASAPPTGRGYYSIDRPIGLITVTAPRSLLAKIEGYLTNLKKELYRQVSIEAKIVEVTLTNDNTTGINWENLLNDATVGFGFTLDLAKSGTIIKSTTSVPGGGTPGSLLTLDTKSFSLFIDAIKEQGHVEVLANPRISVMNGQPAMLSVGDNVTFVDKVSSTTTDGVTTTAVTTASVMSGLGLGVIATILENDEIVLSLTPVTSELTLPIEYRTFGSNQVGLPQVQLREMNTMVRVKNGEMLVVGGLIDNTTTYNNDYVAGLGKLPGAGKAFRTDGTNLSKKELVILMRPRIISF